MLVSSARDHSGAWCLAALNVEVCRVVTNQVSGHSESRLVGQGGTGRRYSTFGGGGGPCAVRGCGPVVRRSRLGWHVPWPPPARVGRSNSVAGPGELAEGRLPVWGSAEPAVRIRGRVVGPIRVGRPTPPATTQTGEPGPAAYRAVELPSPTAGQTDCRRAVGPWTRSGSKNTVPNPPSRSTRVRARARHPALRTHEGHPGAVR